MSTKGDNNNQLDELDSLVKASKDAGIETDRAAAAFAAEQRARSAAGQLARGARSGSAPVSHAHAEQNSCCCSR